MGELEIDYFSKFKELQIETNPIYPRNDIGVARLFFDLHSDAARYVIEAKSWYHFDGRRWKKDEGGFRVMEMCKSFAESFVKYVEATANDKTFSKYAASFTGRKRREGILSDARSIKPMNISMFDRNKNLFNCQNGTYDLAKMEFRPHSRSDFITNMAHVKFNAETKCERWERFISEIMCGDADTARFLQKAFGYGLSGETNLECFFILYGSKTRNGKSTLTETIGNLMGDYSKTIQPQSLSKRSDNGASASPDMARLKGARLVNVAEPEKGLELNTALIKQLTGGDTYTGRLLYENSIEFKPEFKMYINTNHNKAHKLLHNLTRASPSDFPFYFYVLVCCSDNRNQTVNDLPLVVKGSVFPIG